MPELLDRHERAALCAAVSLPDLLAADGYQVRRAGSAGRFVVSLRHDDGTPSCHLYAPNVGSQGGKGWTYYDYGSGEGGDVLGYLVDVRRMDFVEAVEYLKRQAGRDTGKATNKATKHRTPLHTAPAKPLLMPYKEQLQACKDFLLCLEDANPNAAEQGNDYLRRRGVLVDGLPPTAYALPAKAMPVLYTALSHAPRAELIKRVGLLKPDGLQWDTWAGDVVLLAYLDAEGRPAAFVARRTQHKPEDRLGKYLQQTYAHGAARLPFGLLTLYRPAGLQWKPAPEHKRQLLILEGQLDALGAAKLGWPALGLGMRPCARDWTDEHGAAPRMLEPHLSAMRDTDGVLVVPDADKGDKEAEGIAKANALVGWLRGAGCKAKTATLGELYADAPETCKDFADIAAQKGRGK